MELGGLLRLLSLYECLGSKAHHVTNGIKTLLHVFFYVVIQTCCIVNTGHIHRQNRLEEHGVKIAVQKLERTEHSVLKNV